MNAIDVLTVGARAVGLAAIIVVTGACVFRWGVLRRWTATAGAAPASWSRLISTAGAIGAVSAVLVAPVRLFAQASSLVDAGDPVMPMMKSVLLTHWGEGLVVQCATAAMALVGFLLARRGMRAGWFVAATFALVLNATPALMGHAAAAERYRVLSMGADWGHVTGAGGWVGALAMLALAARRAEAADVSGMTTATLIELFHPVALVSVSVVVLSGVTSVWLRVPHLRDILTSTYGALLIAKLVCTAAVAAVGFHHSRRGSALARTQGPRAVRRTLVLEAALAVLVIGVTGVLVGTSPPMADHGDMAMRLQRPLASSPLVVVSARLR